MTRRSNRLADETSPYLLQHANNPVDWFPWGPDALRLAREQDRPILLSIGYAACHWCHVMERESFEDEAIAAKMNESFVCIKVDREERPDLDEIYMNATVALSGSGGWPMTVFLTPDQRPFFAGTYFPPQSMHGRPGFPELLERIAQLWKEERSTLLQQANELTAHVQAASGVMRPGGISADGLRAASRALRRDFDPAFGGFGRAPKFPNAGALALLLRQYRRTGQHELLEMVTRTLDGMMSGGMYDQLAGGFARYSVDEKWLVPHFEKMLYDNAQLAEAYLEAYQLTGNEAYRRIARETLDYVLRDMTSPEGAFFSSTDADSEGEEGKYFVWTRTEIEKALGRPRADHFCALYGVSEEGNFEGKNVLTAWRTVSDVAKDFGLAEAELLPELEESRQKLLQRRSARVAPAVDDKIITSWNALMIRALAMGARALGDPRYLQAAEDAADFLLSALRAEDGSLLRTARGGRAHVSGFLEDYSYLSDALISLYEAGGPAGSLLAARELLDRMLEEFGGEDSAALYSTSSRAEQLVARPRSGHDGALPNANAVACMALARASAHFGDDGYRQRAESLAQAFASGIKRAPRAFCWLLCAVDFLMEPPIELVFAGDPKQGAYDDLVRAAGARFLPNRVEAHAASWSGLDEVEARQSPLMTGRSNTDGSPRAFVCEGFACRAPLSDADELTRVLDGKETDNRRRRPSELGTTILTGRATAEGTRARLQRGGVGAKGTSTLGSWAVSRLGVGSYRIGLDNPQHRETLRSALEAGLNLIDTSPSFAWGDSQRLIGETLTELEISREELVVISKLGVAVGADAEELSPDSASPVAAETVLLGRDGNRNEGICCLHPDFLEGQLERSLERLRLDHLDVCLIQSPEHLLLRGTTRAEFERRVRRAFEFLEKQAARGRIGLYGVLTNTATRAADDAGFVDVEQLLRWAHEAHGDSHGFRVVQLPVNLIEREALAEGSSASLSSRLKQLGMHVLAVRPLSALSDGKLLRLIDVPPAQDGASASELSSARYRVQSLEAEFETRLAPQLRLAKLADEAAVLPLSGPLGRTVESVESYEQFQLAETTLVTPRLRATLTQLDRVFAESNAGDWQSFRDKYVEAVAAWLAAVRETAKLHNQSRLDALRTEIPASPEFAEQVSTSTLQGPMVDQALALLLGRRDLDAVLVGLRQPAHVETATKLVGR